MNLDKTAQDARAPLEARAQRPRPSAAELAKDIRRHLFYTIGLTEGEPEAQHFFRAAGYAVRDRLLDGLRETERRYRQAGARRMYYLSLEFLVGRSLRGNLSNLGFLEECKSALRELNVSPDEVFDTEPDAGLGNGGLGRLAACFLESLATLGMPGFGYGINYEFGLFRQEIRGGAQLEQPDQWFGNSSPWLIEHPEQACLVPVYGRVLPGKDRHGAYNPMWLEWRLLVGVPSDMPIAGYGAHTVNWLRLFEARSSNEFDISIFNEGDYLRATEQKIASEAVSKVLYPSDAVPEGRELRLVQEYFLVACAIRDIVGRHLRQFGRIDNLHEQTAIQLNDTHPALSVAELMRTLVDEHEVSWERACEQTLAICGYTNHTLLPEALEKWPVELMRYVLPRHLQIILELNHRFLGEVRTRFPGDDARLRRMSMVEEGPVQQIRMAHLAIAGSHAVNGVSELHSRLVREALVPDFASMWPERFSNKTNGITHRRWLLEANPKLAELITSRIGKNWIVRPEELSRFAAFATDDETHAGLRAARQAAKHRLAEWIRHRLGERVHTSWIFDVHIKRIHEYKRQLLNVLGIIDDYLRITEDGRIPPIPRVSLFAGKAAPGYFMAKQIIRLIHAVGSTIRNDGAAREHLAVLFLPDYKVSLAELMIPAADLSEQISTAGTEASGTGNMKLALNGALTIGTIDGANVEIRDAVGPENFYCFGLTTAEVEHLRVSRGYSPRTLYETNPRVRRVVDALASGRFSPSEPNLFSPIVDALLGNDHYFHLADLESYTEARRAAVRDFADAPAWAAKAIRNIAGMGRFSSDRTVSEYASDIWKIVPCV